MHTPKDHIMPIDDIDPSLSTLASQDELLRQAQREQQAAQAEKARAAQLAFEAQQAAQAEQAALAEAARAEQDRIAALSTPQISSRPASSHPAIPEGMKMSCHSGPDSFELAPDCPVIEWGELTFWPYSYDDNRMSVGAVAYDSAGNLCRSVEVPGSRYIWKITVDPDAETVTFWGQGNTDASVTWAALREG